MAGAVGAAVWIGTTMVSDLLVLLLRRDGSTFHVKRSQQTLSGEARRAA